MPTPDPSEMLADEVERENFRKALIERHLGDPAYEGKNTIQGILRQEQMDRDNDEQYA